MAFNYRQLMSIVEIQEKVDRLEWEEIAGWCILELAVMHLAEHIKRQEKRIAELEKSISELTLSEIPSY